MDTADPGEPIRGYPLITALQDLAGRLGRDDRETDARIAERGAMALTSRDIRIAQLRFALRRARETLATVLKENPPLTALIEREIARIDTMMEDRTNDYR